MIIAYVLVIYFQQVHPLHYISTPHFLEQYLMGLIILPSYVIYFLPLHPSVFFPFLPYPCWFPQTLIYIHVFFLLLLIIIIFVLGLVS
jgi:hypothetical protein